MSDELKDQRIPIMMSPSEVKAVDDWMFSHRIKSRAEAIRRLCQMGIAIEETIPKIADAFALGGEASSKFVEEVQSLDREKEEEVPYQIMYSYASELLDSIIQSCDELETIGKVMTLYGDGHELLKGKVIAAKEALELLKEIDQDEQASE